MPPNTSVKQRLAAGEKLSDILRSTHAGDSMREEIGALLLDYYAEGLSIRGIRDRRHPDLSFGTIRSLLVRAGVEFRGR